MTEINFPMLPKHPPHTSLESVVYLVGENKCVISRCVLISPDWHFASPGEMAKISHCL